MPGVSKFTKEKKDEFLEAFVNNNFNLTATCTGVGITHASYYNAMIYDNEFKDKINLYKTIAKTLIDNALLKGVNDSNPEIAAKYLDLIGKHKSFQTIFNIETKEDDGNKDINVELV